MSIFPVLLGVQYVGIAALMIEILYVMKQKTSKLQTLMMLVLIATCINFVGYLFEMQATDKNTALMAIKFIYFGKPYIALSIFLFAMEFYKVRLPRWLVNVLCGIHISVTILVLTCEKHTLYYSSIDYTYEGMFPHLVFGHSIIYKIYNYGFIMGYLLIIVLVGVKNYKYTRTHIEKTRIILMSSISGVSVAGFLLFCSGAARGYDTTVPAYIISATLLMILMFRYDLLDVLLLAKDDIVDEFDAGIVVLDERNRVIYMNKKAGDILAALQEEKAEAEISRLDRLCEQNERLHIEDRIYELRRKKITRNDNFYGNIYIIGDITESYNYTINLEKQKAIAEHANQAKSDFLARMSHEIRTPINSVLGMNEMILRDSTEPVVKRYAMNIKTSANSLLGIINDILDSSKIESGKMEILPVEYDLDSLLNDVVSMIYAKAKDKELRFEVNVNEKLPNKLYGDDVRIRQVLVNLLTNAVKYTHEGSVMLSVDGKSIGDSLLLFCEVKDTGIGIKEEDLPRIFQTFERVDEKRNRNIEGTGLGMNIVQSLLELMGTELKAESVYGSGTTFYFELSQKIISEEPIGNFRETVEKLGEEYQYKSLFKAPQAKILVVDDNEINRMVFTCMLLDTQIQVTEAESGIKALKLVEKERFDMIFLDYMMPELDGVETLHKMRNMEHNLSKAAPVIILTANAVTGAKEQYLAEGFDDYLSKPIIPEKLEQMIKDRLPKEYVVED
ncbi:MAG: response regulator [Lachnospiraceae bacterium]|nr:response regulator [Lachnospiraceae bacterium]MBO5146475.1 response regulator [Lachnospiraceae bacterium]